MDVEDANVYMSRFSKEVWDAFVESRRPTQNVCNLNEANDGQCVEIDVRACRLNGIIEANCEDIPIFSPLDEIVKARQGVLYDYQWIDIGGIRCPLKNTSLMGHGGIQKVKRNTCLKVIYANGDISNWALRQLHTEVLATWQQSSRKSEAFGSKLANLYMLNSSWARKLNRKQKAIFSPRQLC